MKEDGYRLYISLEKDDFTINEMISGNSIVRKDRNYIVDNLDKDIVLQHIHNLQEALLTYKEVRSLSLNLFDDKSDKLIIKEDSHAYWKIIYDGKSAVLADNKLKRQIGFDKSGLLRAVNKLYYALLSKGVNLNPKRDIVRRIADVGVLVWVYDGHSVVCYEKNIQGVCMLDCLIDGVYYDCVIVSSSESAHTVNMFDKDLKREILEWPLDVSILTYYPDISKAIELA